MQTIGDRLKAKRKAMGLSQRKLAEMIGLTGSAIGHVELNKNELAGKHLVKAAEVLQTTASYLQNGIEDSAPTPWDSNIELIHPPTKRIPVLTYVQAGNWRECISHTADEYVFAHVPVSERTFAAKIRGNSMMPEFKENEIIIIDTQVTAQPGDYVLAQNGQQEATFKKYRSRGCGDDGRDVFDLVPLNDDYAVMHTDSTKTQIIGVIVEHIRIMR